MFYLKLPANQKSCVTYSKPVKELVCKLHECMVTKMFNSQKAAMYLNPLVALFVVSQSLVPTFICILYIVDKEIGNTTTKLHHIHRDSECSQVSHISLGYILPAGNMLNRMARGKGSKAERRQSYLQGNSCSPRDTLQKAAELEPQKIQN